MKIESILIIDLHLDPANARKHNDKNLSAIAASLKKFGQQKPIVIDKNNVVIAGNGTLEAAKSLKWEKINAVRTDLKGTEAIAFALADNKTAELAEWDDDILSKTLESLLTEGFDIQEVGFDLGSNEPKPITENKELSIDDFNNFENQCPRCGFEYDGKDSQSLENGAMEPDGSI